MHTVFYRTIYPATTQYQGTKDQTMKMSQERYNLLKSAITKVADHWGRATFVEHTEQTTPTATAWLLHNLAVNQLQYDDTHPFFQNGKWERIVPYQPSFNMYIDNGNNLTDNHIQTAIIKISKELGLWLDQTSTK